MMKYDLGTDDLTDWIVSETMLPKNNLGKAEAIMSLGNGYMGLRSATEEPYVGEVRNCFIAGTYNRFDQFEVSELPNMADVTRLDIRVDGERLDVIPSRTKLYARSLNLKTAELTRSFVWETEAGKQVAFSFRRFVSLDNLHLIGIKMEVTALQEGVQITVGSGVNAQLSNSGAQHFHEGEKRIYDKKYIELLQRTTESEIDFVIHAVHAVTVDEVELEPFMRIDRRVVELTYTAEIAPNQTLVFEKLATVYTSRDKELEGMELQPIRDMALKQLRACAQKGYDTLFTEHASAWRKQVWEAYSLNIESNDGFDILAARFALYHLTVMTPAHDERIGIAAKGLSGEGYQGHSFWDTEMFILPFFIYCNPQVARSLLTYRYLGLEGARKKASKNGYEGAMFPWESAWPADGEVTPDWGRVDVVTGKQTRIWTGLIEQHITSDISFAVWQYYMITNDQAFMQDYGYEILFDTAKFWASRLEWNENQRRYEINDVIGPDEYKEHIDNNAFTNYMAHFNLELAMKYYHEVKQDHPRLFTALNDKLHLEQAYPVWKERTSLIYLPKPREEDAVIPQDDTYLSKPIIDLTKYKNQTHVATIFADYNMDQISGMQISKQADIMILFYLMENRFTEAVKIANYNYYEPKTLHDSSLSLSTHAILANDLDDRPLAYKLYRQACEIDLGPEMKSSDLGVHTASLGGIWQVIVMGFAGVRMVDGKLRINPKLPEHWSKLQFSIHWQGQPLAIEVTHHSLVIAAQHKQPVNLEIRGTKYHIEDILTIPLG